MEQNVLVSRNQRLVCCHRLSTRPVLGHECCLGSLADGFESRNKKACRTSRSRQAYWSGGEGIRTPDLLNAIQTRSQLRHAPILSGHATDATGSPAVIQIPYQSSSLP